MTEIELDLGSSWLKGLYMEKSYIYILTNISRTVLYIGVTSNLIKRILEHKEGIGSIFTKKISSKIFNIFRRVYRY